MLLHSEHAQTFNQSSDHEHLLVDLTSLVLQSALFDGVSQDNYQFSNGLNIGNVFIHVNYYEIDLPSNF